MKVHPPQRLSCLLTGVTKCDEPSSAGSNIYFDSRCLRVCWKDRKRGGQCLAVILYEVSM